MIERLATLRSFIRAGGHHRFRHSPEEFGLDHLAESFSAEAVSPVERSARMLKALLNAETPIILDGEKIVATRTIGRIPSISQIKNGRRSAHSIPCTKEVPSPTFPRTTKVF